MDEMERRGYHPDQIWRNTNYRGSTLGYSNDSYWNCGTTITDFLMSIEAGAIIYPEHNDEYLQECINNLKEKGIEIEI